MISDENTRKLERWLYNIDHRLDSIDENLAAHMKRSDLLEAQVKPMLELKTEIKGMIKLVKFIAVLAAIVECVRAFWP